MSILDFPGKVKSVDVDVNGNKWTFETGLIAKLAAGSAILKAGGTVVMATVTYAEPLEELDFFPLTVDYVERLYAGGKISSSRFVKREGRPTIEEVLTARLIDRSVRSLFPEGFNYQVQVVVTVLSYDPEFDPKLLAINAVSAALSISGLPFEGPIAGLRVGLINDEFKIYTKVIADEWIEEETALDLVFSASKNGIVMFDADANIVPDKKIVDAMKFGFDEAQKLINAQEEFIKLAGGKKLEYELNELPADLLEKVKSDYGEKIKKAVLEKGGKSEGDFLSQGKESIKEQIYSELEGKFTKSAMSAAVEKIKKTIIQKLISEEQKRLDGRSLDEIRQIDAKTGLLPRTHGSALFTRGETQAFSVTTIGTLKLGQLQEGVGGEEFVRYMHHYNMPPYATGEFGRFMLSPNRRETGHGALAQKAIVPVLPSKEDFPYAMRVVSEITQSNGSSSMAATCGSSISLMDAGVPIKATVGGVAMGLIFDEKTEKYHILTDIMGIEDFCGHMDFKVAGTKEGVTAIQLDNKLKSISIEILEDAMEKAKTARLKIIDIMEKVIEKPRAELSEFAPRVETIKIDQERIGELIGPGGKNIKGLVESTGAEISVEEDGTVMISAVDEESRKKAYDAIYGYSIIISRGEVFKGKVEKLLEFGAIVSLPGGRTGLLHISEIREGFVKDVNEYLKIGDEVEVKVIDMKEGKISLSMKALGKGPDKKTIEEDK